MAKQLMVLIMVACLVQAPSASAQAGAVISILGGVLSAGSGQRDREANARRAEEEKLQREAERADQDARDDAAYAERVAKADAQRKEDERMAEERAVAIRAKRIQPATIEDLESLYEADDGVDIARSPKIKPDRAQYLITGKISRHVADDILICETIPENDELIGHHFTVRFTKRPRRRAIFLTV